MIDTNLVINLDTNTIRKYLLLKNEEQVRLFEKAREFRNGSKYGKKIELRSVVEISNICTQQCRYCSMGKNNKSHYMLEKEEILHKLKVLAQKGRRTFLLQSGEIKSQKYIDELSFVCEKTKLDFPDIQIILCLGNLSYKQYKQLFDSGASRYILKFETSNPLLHKYCRPLDTFENRLECIQNLIQIGYKVGSGNIVGLPNQTIDDLIEDLKLISKLDLAMVSATKFIPNNFSEFRNFPSGNIDLTLNFLALLRILKPNCLIPSTSSLETGNINGLTMGILAGCNTLTIHDGTPKHLEKNYSIYTENRFIPTEGFCKKIIADAGMEAAVYLL